MTVVAIAGLLLLLAHEMEKRHRADEQVRDLCRLLAEQPAPFDIEAEFAALTQRIQHEDALRASGVVLLADRRRAPESGWVA